MYWVVEYRASKNVTPEKKLRPCILKLIKDGQIGKFTRRRYKHEFMSYFWPFVWIPSLNENWKYMNIFHRLEQSYVSNLNVNPARMDAIMNPCLFYQAMS